MSSMPILKGGPREGDEQIDDLDDAFFSPPPPPAPTTSEEIHFEAAPLPRHTRRAMRATAVMIGLSVIGFPAFIAYHHWVLPSPEDLHAVAPSVSGLSLNAPDFGTPPAAAPTTYTRRLYATVPPSTHGVGIQPSQPTDSPVMDSVATQPQGDPAEAPTTAEARPATDTRTIDGAQPGTLSAELAEASPGTPSVAMAPPSGSGKALGRSDAPASLGDDGAATALPSLAAAQATLEPQAASPHVAADHGEATARGPAPIAEPASTAVPATADAPTQPAEDRKTPDGHDLGSEEADFAKAYDLLNHGQYAEAANEALRITEAKPALAEAWLVLGNAYDALGRRTDAQSAYSRCSESDGAHAASCQLLLQ